MGSRINKNTIVATVLIAAGIAIFFIKKSPRPVPSRTAAVSLSDWMQSRTETTSTRWQERSGWWGGFWWGSGPFWWKKRYWGPGYSAYPWYWHTDAIAIELDLVGLAQAGHWIELQTLITQEIQRTQQEIRDTANRIKKRKLGRMIERLERYLYDATEYQRTPVMNAVTTKSKS